jgi:ribosomal protein L29
MGAPRDDWRDQRVTDLRDRVYSDIARLEENIRELRREILDLRLEKMNRPHCRTK